MIATARSATAHLIELWQQAEVVRREWLEVGLSTEPADRSATEEILTQIYARHRRSRPLRFLDVLGLGVREGLFRSLAFGIYLPVRAALGGVVPVGRYGNQDASWIGYFDALRRLGLAQYPADFDRWAALARAAGWWWPGEHECVLVERPVELKVSAVPGGFHGEVKLERVVYRDGWTL